ncbi:DUF6456 domain-containing protein [Pseudovibrio sp. SPO723]|uniref:DUF6456 domain-containing protein n=1 Tax=Nesiotobacter zosterae TaxID=392721 RepID=UPI0029C303E1|nr:DUF6456 domain-containing protein [Pseudovibrio sp. SPO723]MDX5595609.1 DUF6456 domain-containing protein [Pseudovibrio sp. SPO723]
MSNLRNDLLRLLRVASGKDGLCHGEAQECFAKALEKALAEKFVVQLEQRLFTTPDGRRFLKRGLCEGGLEASVTAAQSGMAISKDSALDESPLAWLASRKAKDGKAFLSREQLVAAEKFSADYAFGQVTSSLKSNWRTVHIDGAKGGQKEMTEGALNARRRTHAAIEAMGPELSSVVVDVCCFMKGLRQVEFERQWPARTARIVLGLGLSSLARHYQLATASKAQRTARSWQDGDKAEVCL